MLEGGGQWGLHRFRKSPDETSSPTVHFRDRVIVFLEGQRNVSEVSEIVPNMRAGAATHRRRSTLNSPAGMGDKPGAFGGISNLPWARLRLGGRKRGVAVSRGEELDPGGKCSWENSRIKLDGGPDSQTGVDF